MRISTLTQKRIYELWFQAVPRDSIGQRLNISGSTVSEVVGLLPESLGTLRSLCTELRKTGLSPSEANEGAKLVSKLAQLGLRPNELENYIEASTKIAKEAGYEPAQVVRATMTLSNLEAKAEKSYFEVLREFEAKTKRNRSLKETNRQLEQERKQKLAKNGITENEIRYITDLRRNLHLYGIALADAENLQHYLQNMHETNGDPTKFIEYTRKHDSLETTLASLERQVQSKAEVLQTFEHKIETYRTEIGRCSAELSSLGEEVCRVNQNLKIQQQQEQETQARIDQKLALLSGLLEVGTESKTLKEALDSKREELRTLGATAEEARQALRTIGQSIQEAEINKGNLEKEIAERLEIKEYSEEKHAAIKRLEDRETSLEKEIEQKSERIALADTITNFLRKQSPYDFNIFHSYIQNMKYARERDLSLWPGYIPVLEEKVRMAALKAFEGDLVSNKQHRELMQKYEGCIAVTRELETKISELEAKHEETNGALERTMSEKQLLEALKTNFEGRSTTLEELRNWTLSTFNEEIQRRADERFNTVAAGICGLIDYAGKQITRRLSPPSREQQ